MVSDLPVRENLMPEYVATFLFGIRRGDSHYVIGAAVDDRGQVVILPLPRDEALPLSIHEATEFQKKIREAVQDASMRQF